MYFNQILKSKSGTQLASLTNEFYELKFEENEEKQLEYFAEEQKQLISEEGFEFPECLVCFRFIRKLPIEYDNSTTSLSTRC
ncbi:hypothetical protein TNIN_177381 [Trichonephila inaurata madagascariensis]|uniref:Uncharacterized protein n=1 Tax=Trichonephila inaurata madagascariensis TaxID=2747483 RepID=A0A8X6YQ92_9ARAC|nr:hypothetical protein TNIN_177381 [Trichonephila inaurata madagascariensis]